MSSFKFEGGDSRDYFPANIGRVDPGDVRDDLKEAPDDNWVAVSDAAPEPVKASRPPVTQEAEPTA